MKLGDVISVIGPGGVVVTGTVLVLEPLTTRSGWTVQIDAPVEHAFLIRPEDEGTVGSTVTIISRKMHCLQLQLCVM